MSQHDVTHEPENKRFIIPLEKGGPAELTYAISTDHTREPGRTLVDFTRTYVPPEYRNKGLAEKLVRRGLAWARDRDCLVEASCSYVASFLKR